MNYAGSSLRTVAKASIGISKKLHVACENPVAPQIRAFGTYSTIHKSRSSFASEPSPPTPGDVPIINTKGKGPKGASKNPTGPNSKRGNKEQEIRNDDSRYSTTTQNKDLPGEVFTEDALKTNMQRAVLRCKETINQKIASYGRADPAILDSIHITFTPPGTRTGESTSGSTSGDKGGGGIQSYPLKDFASVGVKDGALIVTCFDAESIKHVERAIYSSNIGLSPQHVSGAETVLKLPIPRPTAETRANLVKEASRICENARISIRTARQIAQKQIKSDEKARVVSRDEGNREMKKIEEETKRQTAEVDQFLEKAKKRLEQS